jgi:hypothetical protein
MALQKKTGRMRSISLKSAMPGGMVRAVAAAGTSKSTVAQWISGGRAFAPTSRDSSL